MKSTLLALAVITLAGCATREYSVVVVNDTTSMISDATVIFPDGWHSIGGWLPPAIFKVHGSITKPIPERATVQWRTADGVLHRQEVAVRSALPRGPFSGNIYFLIRSNNSVDVTFDDHPQ